MAAFRLECGSCDRAAFLQSAKSGWQQKLLLAGSEGWEFTNETGWRCPMCKTSKERSDE